MHDLVQVRDCARLSLADLVNAGRLCVHSRIGGLTREFLCGLAEEFVVLEQLRFSADDEAGEQKMMMTEETRQDSIWWT